MGRLLVLLRLSSSGGGGRASGVRPIAFSLGYYVDYLP